MLQELWLSFYLAMGSLDELMEDRYVRAVEVARWEWPKDPLRDGEFWRSNIGEWIERGGFFELLEEAGGREWWRSEEFLPWLGYETMETEVVLDKGVPVGLSIDMVNRGDVQVWGAMGKLPLVMKERLRKMGEFLEELKGRVDGVLGVEGVEERERIAKGVSARRYSWRTDVVWVYLNYSMGEFVSFDLMPPAPGKELDEVERAFEESRIVSTGLLREVDEGRLRENVREDGDGGVWVDNVPMVDQGMKGYCTVATMERVFRYYGVSLDQHMVADLARSSALMGTRISLGMEAAERLLKGNDLRLRPLREGNRRELRGEKVAEVVRRGIPIVWNVDLSLSDEPGNAAYGGDFSGHTRLIIGVNLGRREIYYSDSWGLLHGKKVMSLENANRIHINAFYFEPRN